MRHFFLGDVETRRVLFCMASRAYYLLIVRALHIFAKTHYVPEGVVAHEGPGLEVEKGSISGLIIIKF